LNGLSLEDTSAYIEHRLQQVGDGAVRLSFESSVILKIHKISRGIPRLINALCDRILMSAFAQQTYAIHDSVAATAFEELAFICAESAKN
jgi:general secretion pathway protein A